MSARCGTPSGYRAHQYRGEKPCDACASAKAEYDKRWRSAGNRTRLNRLNAKAQSRALKDLKDAHPDEYRAAYEKHKTALFVELVTR